METPHPTLSTGQAACCNLAVMKCFVLLNSFMLLTHPCTRLVPTAPPLSLAPLPLSSLPPSIRSNSVSSYPNDDESFASFVAREAHETASTLDDDQSSLSRSPTPLPSSQPDSDIHTLESLIRSRPSEPSSSSATIQQFGITAQSPVAHMKLLEDSYPAVSVPDCQSFYPFAYPSDYIEVSDHTVIPLSPLTCTHGHTPTASGHDHSKLP